MYPELCWALYFERWEKFQLNSNYIKKTCRHCKIFVMSGLELSGLFSEIKKIPWKKKKFYVPISLAATCIWNGRHFSFVLFWIIGFKAVFFFCSSFFVLFYQHQSHKNETLWWLFLHSENNSYFFSALLPQETAWSGSISFHSQSRNLLQN